MAHRKNLIARVMKQQRSRPASATEPDEASSANDTTLDALLARLDRLEAQLEGLQDAMYRETVRQNGRITAISNHGHDPAGEQ